MYINREPNSKLINLVFNVLKIREPNPLIPLNKARFIQFGRISTFNSTRLN